MRARKSDEQGATAILAAVLALILVGLSAFTLDFGRAYLSERQLQSGADAGALAGAGSFADKTGNCAAMAANSTAIAAARSKAAALLEESRPGATIDDFVVRCEDRGARR